MKPAGLTLLCLVMPGWLVAQVIEPAMPPKTSPRLAGEIRTHFPAYTPPAARPAGTAEAPPFAPDVLELPKFTVKEKRVPTSDPDVWLGDRVVQHKAMAAYQGSMTPLEWALNSWFVPLFSAPASARARAAYEDNKRRDELDRLNHLANVVEKVDPRQAAKIRRALDPTVLPKDGD